MPTIRPDGITTVLWSDSIRPDGITPQYSSHPNFNFAVSRKEAPEKYESYVDLEPGAWTRYRIEVDAMKVGFMYTARLSRA